MKTPKLGTFDADHPLIQRPNAILAWVVPVNMERLDSLLYPDMEAVGLVEAMTPDEEST